MNVISESKRESIRAGLLAWFAVNNRTLPWRQTRDPYRILVSEVMLQQTQVDRVIPYYQRWLEQFPTVERLALAPTSDVIKAWAGLGYNRRAVNLQRTAKAVVDEHGGQFPPSPAELQKLPGIGPYTAGAIAAFAFEQDVAFIDTNMRRVIHRLILGSDMPDRIADDRTVLSFAAELVPEGFGWVWNQALIEFGALHCTQRRPACVICPLQGQCAAYPEIQTHIASLPVGTRLKNEGVFEGSNRQIRGRVVNALRASNKLSLHHLGAAVKEDFTDADMPWLQTIVTGLARDGLVAINEPTASYDADGQSDWNAFVSLPD